MRTRLSLTLGLLACFGSVAAFAHHSFAVFFDEAKVVSISGAVTEFQFRNPHGLIRLTARTKDGKEEVWRAETNSPSILERRGWTKSSLKAGDRITIEGWAARDGSNYLRMRKVVREDGSPVGVPFDAPEIK